MVGPALEVSGRAEAFEGDGEAAAKVGCKVVGGVETIGVTERLEVGFEGAGD